MLLAWTQVAIQEIGRFADYVSLTAEKINGDNQTKVAMEAQEDPRHEDLVELRHFQSWYLLGHPRGMESSQ